MRGVNDIAGGGVEGVAPIHLNGRARCDIDDCRRGRRGIGATIAGHVLGCNVRNGAIVGRNADADADAISFPVGYQLGHDGVGGDGRKGRCRCKGP